jgi:hypothetical protein
MSCRDPRGLKSPPAEASTQGLKCKTNKLTIYDAPDAHFDFSSLFSNVQVEKVGNPKERKKCEK